MSTEDIIPEGRYMARVTEAVLAWTSNRDAQIAIGFEITGPEHAVGRLITSYNSMSDTVISKGKNEGRKVVDLTLDTLETCGWDGEDLGARSLGTCVGHDASIVIAHEEDQKGETRAKVKFVNAPNSMGAAVKERLTDQDAANVTKKFQAAILKRKQQRSAKTGASGQQQKRTPPPNAGDTWDPDEYNDLA